ncbi:MAG: HmuY family protein [Lacibacter sp.]
MKYKNLLFALSIAIVTVSCEKTKIDPASVKTIDFLVNGSATQGNHDFFSFAEGAKVAASDSNSTKWDFAMRFEAFLINSNASGPGNAGVQILDKVFDEVYIAPEEGYEYDTTVLQKAIKGLPNPEWYVYYPATRSFAPLSGKTFVFRTAVNKYAKMEVITAEPTDNDGAPVVPPTRPTKIKYKIRYAYQENGSRNF